MAIHVYFVRHGQTYLNRYNRIQGWSDAPLTEKGQEDAKRAGRLLSKVHFDYLFSSDLPRTLATSRLLLAADPNTDITEPIPEPAFREEFFGSFEGDSIDETWRAVSKAAGIPETADVKAIIDAVGIYKFREATKKADPRHLAENVEELDLRMQRAVKVLREETRNEARVLVVSHGDFIKTLGIKYWDQSDGLHDIPFPENGSVTRGILDEAGNFKIVDYNCSADDL